MSQVCPAIFAPSKFNSSQSSPIPVVKGEKYKGELKVSVKANHTLALEPAITKRSDIRIKTAWKVRS